MRTTLPDGTVVEVLVQFALPLPLTVLPELMAAVSKAAEQLGYTGVGILTEGEYRGAIAGRLPAGGA